MQTRTTGRGTMFHHFHGDAASKHVVGGGSIDAGTFRSVLDLLDRESNLLPAHEFLERHEAGRLAEDACCLTFDDALGCQFEIAEPVLRRHGLTAFWFVYSSPLQGGIEMLEIYRTFRLRYFETMAGFYETFERSLGRIDLRGFNPRTYLNAFGFYTKEDRRFRFIRDEVLGPIRYHDAMRRLMAEHGVTPQSLAGDLWITPEQVRQLHRCGHVIGLHSHTHPTRLNRLPPTQQKAEYSQNLMCLQELLGQTPRTASHPCNSYDDGTLCLLEGMGITLGFRANLQSMPNRSPLELPREDHADLVARLPNSTLRRAA